MPFTRAERVRLSALTVACALVAAGCGGAGTRSAAVKPSLATARPPTTAQPGPATPTPAATHTAPARRRPQTPAPPRAPFAVGLRVVTFVDTSRRVPVPGAGLQPRTLVTLVRYPARGSPAGTDVPNAPPDHAAGRFPLVIFGHGFAVTPTPYAPLLQDWARAGYVVAAPIFPLENANAPGGPNENDMVNQPADMSFLITQMLKANRVTGGFLDRLIDPGEIAVSGQSDGGDTALAVAYDQHFVDRRVRAAVILSGAKIPGVGGFDFPPPSPPLLATQGSADTVNPPSFTHAFYDGAPRPKFLLDLFGADHLGPYTGPQPYTAIVERVTIAFLDHYLKQGARGLARMRAAGNVNGVAALGFHP